MKLFGLLGFAGIIVVLGYLIVRFIGGKRKMNDEKHRKLTEKYIKYLKLFNCSSSFSYYFKLEIEYPYNYYGDRGFKDILTISKSKVGESYNSIRMCEVKPDLDNLGEAIRQLRKAENILPKIGIPGISIFEFKIHLDLVSVLNQKNYEIMKSSYNLLSSLPQNLTLCLLYSRTDTGFTFIKPLNFDSKNIEKYGDFLDAVWK